VRSVEWPRQWFDMWQGNAILAKLSAASPHQIKHIHEPAVPSVSLAGAGVFLIDVISKQSYEHFGANNLRDLYPTL
jgi:hypothetical protein